MSTHAPRSSEIPRARPASPVLRRKCACGGTPGPTGECEQCRKKRLGLQRTASAAGPAVAPPIVHDVLRSPGRPLDPATRADMALRFGHSFTAVRVHTDERAANSAAAVGALAYTVGRDVAFAAGRYAPQTAEGRSLLAHELVHVGQQGGRSASPEAPLEVGSDDAPEEQEAERVAGTALARDTGVRLSRAPVVLRRKALHVGSIVDEGSCRHLACNSVWACSSKDNGVQCPKGTTHAYSKTKKLLYSPMFTCDGDCEHASPCDDGDNWMAMPKSKFGRGKCGGDVVICAGGKSTHGYVRDKSEKELWEVSHGIQDALGVSPYATFTGAIYGDENDAAFKSDKRCPPAAKQEQKEAVDLPWVKPFVAERDATRVAPRPVLGIRSAWDLPTVSEETWRLIGGKGDNTGRKLTSAEESQIAALLKLSVPAGPPMAFAEGPRFVLHDTASPESAGAIAYQAKRNRGSLGKGVYAWVPAAEDPTITRESPFEANRPSATAWEKWADEMTQVDREKEFRAVWQAALPSARESALKRALAGLKEDEAKEERSATKEHPSIVDQFAGGGTIYTAGSWAVREICAQAGSDGVASVAAKGKEAALETACARLKPYFTGRKSRVESTANVEIVQDDTRVPCANPEALKDPPKLSYTDLQYQGVTRLYLRAALTAGVFPEITTHFWVDGKVKGHCDPRCFNLNRLYDQIAATVGHGKGSTYGVKPLYGKTWGTHNVWWYDPVCGAKP